MMLLVALTLGSGLGAGIEAQDARQRIVAEALKQAQGPTAEWDPGQRDCAGFVRYLFRKAWPNAEPHWRDRRGETAKFLEAGELLTFNFDFVTRHADPDRIRTGDVIAFFRPDRKPGDRWHLMVALRPPAGAPGRLLVAYHNGAEGEKGEVRKVWLDDLTAKSPPEWRPVASNPRFLGLFRWKGFKEEG